VHDDSKVVFPLKMFIVGCYSDWRRFFGVEIGFIDHLQVVTTNYYFNIVNLRIFKITTGHDKYFQSAMSLLAVSR
jgi:hypothetical protein